MRDNQQSRWRKQRELLEKKRGEVWWRVIWRSRTAWTFAGAIVTFILMHGNEGLTNLRQLPSEIKQTFMEFQSWKYDDKLWSATWSSREEGNVEDYHLAPEAIRLNLHTEQGKISGELYLDSVCNRNPVLLPVLLEGEILHGQVYAKAFTFVGGQRQTLATFTVQRSDEAPFIVTVRPLADPSGLFPVSARLMQRLEDEHAIENDALTCKNDPAAFVRKLLDAGKKGSTPLSK